MGQPLVKRYTGKVVCITGSSRGIGRTLALRFAAEGADVVINYFRNGDAAREVAREVEALGQKALLARANMAQEEKIIAMFDQIREAFGRLDVFVHNAASGRNRAAMDVDVKGWDWTLNVNTRAFLVGAQQAAKLMPETGGAMLALSSFGSDRVFPYYTTVGPSKAALESLVRYFAIELSEKKVNVNAISAGAVLTDALDHFPEMDDTLAAVEQKMPYHRMVTPDDIANLALFLCSPEAEMIRGQTIRLDGGITLLVP
ncbi:enoyl-[acyl-carrier-protein] reductase FabL [Alicyclobacillus acidoterrestris]|uniref:Enoyl-[acyl-carrier-protein] reductase FabL n=1 Tax=Alicyclobacillus acidoterrestris (strain ATCC 49025 / DSM 3922 / CIP 106132 / NCIMB 13137 / GD3B) TaxID=1356854 RepID=T0C564_ALIAG|nr:enoyl-[acyl-carrier-protein] reductase FabL [Alicyclobacillus acidoterrestris]EPZ48099.1 enoyl-ACP reductase [Alicyclobacillus acidoterrestris ATCC 49025]UNO48638.1 enoyl-[acyl-carrier-protein] reductase FabL [Alicyclobacillus acidoterrestris]